jgi:predicted chitinase
MGKTYVTSEELVNLGWSPAKVTPEMVADLNNTLERFNITTQEKIQLFLSQCSQESGLGQYTKEIDSGWDYEGRIKDLGNIYYGDGPKYKGAGYIQVTGRKNYQKFSDYIGDPQVMEGVDYVAENYPWLAGGFWWKDHNMNKVIDDWKNNPNAKWPIVDEVSRIVNAGENGELKDVYGLDNRRLYYERAVKIGIGERAATNDGYNVKDPSTTSIQSPGLGDLQLFDQQNLKNIAYLDQQQFSFENELNMTGSSDNITLQIGQWSYSTEPITGTD